MHYFLWLPLLSCLGIHPSYTRGVQKQVEGIVSQSPHNPRIQTGTRGSHYGLLVKDVTCTYELPLVRADRVEVGVRVSSVGRTSFVMEHQIRDIQYSERIFAMGRSVMVW